MQEKFLPIGSVVLLKGGTKKVMITGYCMTKYLTIMVALFQKVK